ncbi:hypothetical protein QJS10_CPB15g01077 [Acorus calamus]|uniref:Uncharacterized protein n=1 Tax=Acorus calamus TaxID=4465 RepID=A0AAV9D4I4_ACOCL|nr:hypothetical protein QJS10_CPB15g01077 [Acorus calamus]
MGDNMWTKTFTSEYNHCEVGDEGTSVPKRKGKSPVINLASEGCGAVGVSKKKSSSSLKRKRNQKDDDNLQELVDLTREQLIPIEHLSTFQERGDEIRGIIAGQLWATRLQPDTCPTLESIGSSLIRGSQLTPVQSPSTDRIIDGGTGGKVLGDRLFIYA